MENSEVQNNPYNERFKSAPWLKPQTIIIGGCGGIGSPLAYLLARQGHELYLYDDDTYEDLNMGSQLIEPSMIGENKAQALTAKIVRETGNVKVNPLAERFTENSMAANIMIAAFDNMESRKVMIQRWWKYQTEEKEKVPGEINMFMESGMEAEFGAIKTITRKSHYKQWLDEFTPDDAMSQPVCSFRATAHNSFIMAGLMVSILNNHIVNKTQGLALRMMPYKHHYDLVTLSFDNKNSDE